MSARIWKCLAVVFVMGVMVFGCWEKASADTGGQRYTPVSARVVLGRSVYDAGQPVTGQVTLINNSVRRLTVTFEIALYHDGKIWRKVTTETTVWPGTSTDSLKELGVPQVNEGPSAAGAWKIAIRQQDTAPSDEASATFTIRPSPDK